MATNWQAPTRMDERFVAPNVPIGSYTSVASSNIPAYTAPGWEDGRENFYMDSPSGAWAPGLHQVPGGTPDPMRTQQLKQRDYRPTPLTDAPRKWWLGIGGPGREEQARHNSQEDVDADGWAMTRGDPGNKRAAPDVRRTPPPENRLTQQMSPNNYTYTRPFDQTVAHFFNGAHFSMADHRRNYTIHGMKTTPTRRNTYRLDPPPWDTDIVDLPVGTLNSVDIPDARLKQVELPMSGNRAYRL
jgi:hypothetical protein